MLHTKNYQNWPMLHEVIQKIKLARFLLRHGVVTEILGSLQL